MTSFFTLAAAVPALLMPAAAVPPAAIPAFEATTAATAAAPAHIDKRRYCFVDEVSGSRLPRKQCQTREGWARDGVDVDQLTK